VRGDTDFSQTEHLDRPVPFDTGSRRRLTHQLEQMRGFSLAAQQAVVKQLGGARLSSLDELTPRQYFARLWHQLTQGRKPHTRIGAPGGALTQWRGGQRHAKV